MICFFLFQGDNGVNLSVMDSKLTDADKLDCARIIQSYVGGRINDPIVAGITSPLRFKECMKIFKTMVMKHYGQSEGKGSFTATPLTAWAEAEEPRYYRRVLLANVAHFLIFSFVKRFIDCFIDLFH